MKLIIAKCIIISVASFLFGCTVKEPKVCISILTTMPVANEVINFKNCSTFGRGTALWDFGDGVQVRNQMPEISHIYKAKGTYHIALEVFKNGESDKISTVIVIE